MKALHIIATIMLLLFVFVGGAVNAWAKPPLSETNYYPDSFPIVQCDGYQVWTSAEVRETETVFFDKDGKPARVRVFLHVRDAIYYNSLDPEIYIQQGVSGTGEGLTLWINLVTGTERFTGRFARITLPGVGVLYLEMGRAHWDGENWSFNGISVFPEAGTGSALCEALAP